MFYLNLSFQLKIKFRERNSKISQFFWLRSVSSLSSSCFVAKAAETLFFSLQMQQENKPKLVNKKFTFPRVWFSTK